MDYEALEIEIPSDESNTGNMEQNQGYEQQNNQEQIQQEIEEQKYNEYYSYDQCFSIYMNKCGRDEMQDRFMIVPKFGEEEMSYFGVFDGHGSPLIAEFLSQKLHEYIISSIDFKTDIKKAIKQGFARIDEYVQQSKELNPKENGSVVLCGIIYQNQLYLANLGDSKAIITNQDNSLTELTNEHKPSHPEEKKRIEDLGGFIIQRGNTYRINGSIDISRAIGDSKYKPYIISEPEITQYRLNSENKYLIIATDGLWNNRASNSVVEYSQLSESIVDLPKVIFSQCENEKRMKDNTTILCLDIQQYLNRKQNVVYNEKINNNNN